MSRWTFLALLALLFHGVRSEILTPPYFNLAEGKEIIASATCGEGTPGPELYCKLVGANADQDEDINLIQGQVCDYCDPNNPEKRHPPEYAVDGMETWWQSPPLSRGMQYNEVNLTINLGQEFHVAYIYVRMGNSPRPGLWILEKSTDYGKTWSTWQYFSDSASDCLTYFSVDSHKPIARDDDVICTTEYSKIVPLEGGEIPISILNNRPSAKHYFNSTILQEWTRATNVRFRFLRTKNLLGHLMSVARQDPTVTRRYFYSIKDISIGGRCMCNGHADTCDIQDPNMPKKLVCRCQHNTCGAQCATCCKGFEQKKWRQSTTLEKFVCEPCNCFGHSDECIYNGEIDEKRLSLDIHGNYEGGGVCQNCRHNTEGINCNRCKPRFYRPRNKQLNDTDVCQPCNCDHFYSTGNCADITGECECRPEFTPPKCDSCNYGYFGYPNCRPCDCHLKGTIGYHCEARAGSCPCKDNYSGRYCNECAEGYYNFPECIPCECNSLGSLNNKCDVVSGNCTCKNNYGGRTCDICEDGYYNYPSCTYCNCDTRGTESSVCDKSDGRCLCKEGYGGARCDQCLAGYYGYPNCRPCNCSVIGSSSIGCDASGKCSCLANFAGRTCDQCSPGYYMYPDCISCNCDNHGAIGVSCDLEGNCQCRENFDGNKCDQCKEGFYNFPTCEGCNCDPSGVVATFLGCGSLPPGELCQCKERVEGRICNRCKPLYWNLQYSNPEGCEECRCNIPGVIGSIGECDSKTGQCICKPGVTERSCSQCVDGTYNLQESNLFGCSDCACDIGGSISSICDKNTGQCPCQPRVAGLTCKEPLQAHYFPTLHQFQYEAENGRTPNNNPVRYGYAEDLFPGYSWKGYAVFSTLQDEIIHDVDIQKPSLYRMVLRYVNPNNESILGSITITPDNPTETEQRFKVLFKSTTKPSFVTVAGPLGNSPSAMVMNPGHWSISVSTKKSLFLDYIVLLPLEYYEATILTQDVNIPCEIGLNGLCRHYGYPTLSIFDSVLGTGGYVNQNNVRSPLTEYYTDREALETLGEDELPLINDKQNQVHFELRVTKPGPYILVVTYVTDKDQSKTTSTILVEANGDTKGKMTLYPCRYTSLCRQVITDVYGKVAVHNFTSNYVTLIFTAEPHTNAGIKSIVAIPHDRWSLDYLKPKSVCVRKNSKCVQGIFSEASVAKKIEFEASNKDLETNGKLTPLVDLFDKSASFVYLDESNSMIDVPAKVPRPGEYVFVVQYYQPDYPEYEVDVLVQNGKFYEATLSVPHCPSNSGCRSIVRQMDGDTKFQLIENFVLTLKEDSGQGIWLDYLLVIPAEQYNEKVLLKLRFDQTKEFIKKCGNNHFYVNVNETGFCRDSIFSLTAHYNNRALPCQCDIEGTTSFECEKFGGQCPCKPNIIGRRCEICKTGFYGFPNCKPCNCPSTAICEPERGECICPPHVTGERCDQCEPETYGFDPIIGCEECNCSPLGVINGDVQCDLFDGTCKCKENVVGRQCDKCAPGFSQFPHCEICDCDLRGTTDEICDQYTAECFCKANVQGQACDLCKEGTFNLQVTNDEGCSKCFCFGKTTRCVSANLYRTHIMDMSEWSVALINDKTGDISISVDLAGEVNETTIALDLMTNKIAQNVSYFSAPSVYLDKKLTSYGGLLNYTIYYMTDQFGEAVSGADVVLQGADAVLFYYHEEQPPSYAHFEVSVELVESNFVTVNKAQATREQMIVVLESLQGLYIRANYWDPTVTAVLSYVTMDVTTESYARDSVLASSVEQCQCPPNYQGYSCEECAPGYYRVQSGPYGGYCVKCQCHGHSDICDVSTGICYDCKNGTTGDHCEYCEVGYYGNATVGTPSDCLICACPLPIASNNFATGCEVSDDGSKISCQCLPGYYGARCQSCAAGFYGQPEVYGDFCKPCECSGNIDTNEIGSCDSITGECLHCLNNTYGEACNLCAPGYFGDAVERKDCQSCLCDVCGMERCDSYSGSCHCRENVVGEKCDRCADNHYGFKTCDGCRPCNCGLASDSSQCDDETGQCRCKPGVTGRMCDRCIAGYWNYGPEGCISCGCNTGYSVGASCDTETGQCTCLPGVIGEKCDHCPYRYVLIEGDGCFECDSCIHDLLDVTDDLSDSLNPVFDRFNTVADSYFTNQRLKFINDSVDDLYPEVKLLNPSSINFVPLQDKIFQLEEAVHSQRRKADYLAEDSIKWREGAEKTLDDMNELDKEVIREIDFVKSVIKEVRALATSIEVGTGTEVDNALKEADDILKKIQEVSFVEVRDKVADQLEIANILLSEMSEYNFPVKNLSLLVDDLDNRVKNFSIRIDDLYNISRKAEELADNVERLNYENTISAEMSNVETVKNATVEATQDLEVGEKLNEEAKKALDETHMNLMHLKSDTSPDAGEQLNDTLVQNDNMLLQVLKIVPLATEHADSLYDRSITLDEILTDTRNTSAVRAVAAYRDIEKAITSAQEAALEASQAANNATKLSDGIENRAFDSHEKSIQLLDAAKAVLKKTNGELQSDLEKARITVNDINDQTVLNKDNLDRIEKLLGSLPSQSAALIAQQALNDADNVEYKMEKVTHDFKDLLENIPTDLKETKQLSKDTADSIRDISQANKQLDSLNKVIPNITTLLGDLDNRQKAINITGNNLYEKIENLKRRIANARELADRFKTGLTFFRNTTLELKNPESLPLLATSTKISVYFRTNKTNGFLLYLGNEENAKLPRTKTHDFMALLIESGYPVLIIDLGSGPQKIISKKFVSDNVWRQIIVDRTGRNIKLIIREDIGGGKDKFYVKEEVLPGSHSIFNVDQEHSKLFVGGYPSSFQIQDAVTSSSFEGQMEELVIGDVPVSFWNFIDGENNYQGAMERDKLINFQPSTGLRFDKTGYAVLSKRNSQIPSDAKKFSIKLNFKTFEEEGLIYLMGKNQHFLSLEMRNGFVYYQYNLGEGTISLRSTEQYNDGSWHTLEALRLEETGVLKIDGHLVAKDKAPGRNKNMGSSDYIYFGGYPPTAPATYPSVTTVGFEGCIDEVVILETSVDLSRNIQAFGVMPGCPVKFASLVSFDENNPGYVKWPNVSVSNALQLSLKFKTLANNGLIFHVTNVENTETSALSLIDGLLVFESRGERLQTSPAGIKFNDDEWHVVTATHNDNALRLDIDDTENYSTDTAPPPLFILYGALYIGGVPQHIHPTTAKGYDSFNGCIGDATLNGVIINFANTTDRPNAHLGRCRGGDSGSPAVKPELITLPPPVTEKLDDFTLSVTKSNIVDVKPEIEDDTTTERPFEGRYGVRVEETPEPETTTKEPYKITTPSEPETVDNCRLPHYPASDPDAENSWRLGAMEHSRLEFNTLGGRYKDDYDFQIDIKTMSDEGVVFYATNNEEQHLISVFIKDGKVHYKFDCGSGPVLLQSQWKINDNQWHTIVFRRKSNYGEMLIDDQGPIYDYSENQLSTTNVKPPFYVGGVPTSKASNVYERIGTNKPFSGCLKNFMLNGQPVSEPARKNSVIPCSKRVEPGLFLYPGNGSNFYIAADKYVVHRMMDIQMDIKPRSTSGHLLSVHGKYSYVLLEMVNGTVRFLVKSIKGDFIETSYQPTHPNTLCDGNWHNIRALKQKNAVVLSVDHKTAPIGMGSKSVAPVVTRHPLFIGGHTMLSKMRGSLSRAQYVGCINNVIINSISINFEPGRAQGRVLMGICPTI